MRNVSSSGAFLCMMCLCALYGAEADVSRGLKPLSITDEQGQKVTFNEHHALIIGNSHYSGAWDPLPGVVNDVAAVKACLEKQGFDVQVEMDQTKQGLADVLDAFIEEKTQREDSRIVIYYAGHGYTAGKVGYLVGVDAPKPAEKGFLRKAYEIANVKVKAQQAKSRHVMFAFDACFAGSIFTPMRGANDYVLSAARDPVRMFLTSGSADEQVPDQSYFRQEFIAGLEGAADANKDTYVTGSELATYLKQTVHDRAAAAGIRLTPQAGVSEQEGYNRGDMVFLVRHESAPAAPAADPGFNIADVVSEDNSDRERWAKWQQSMEKAFNDIQSLRSEDVNLKKRAWSKFLAMFANDNPYSSRDDDLRKRANGQVQELNRTDGAAVAGPVDGDHQAAQDVPSVETSPSHQERRADGAAEMDEVQLAELFRAFSGSYTVIGVDGKIAENMEYLGVNIDDEKKPFMGSKKPRAVRISNDSTRPRDMSAFRLLDMTVSQITPGRQGLVLQGVDGDRGVNLRLSLERSQDGTVLLSFNSTAYRLRKLSK
jgi:hypothetical protein